MGQNLVNSPSGLYVLGIIGEKYIVPQSPAKLCCHKIGKAHFFMIHSGMAALQPNTSGNHRSALPVFELPVFKNVFQRIMADH